MNTELNKPFLKEEIKNEEGLRLPVVNQIRTLAGSSWAEPIVDSSNTILILDERDLKISYSNVEFHSYSLFEIFQNADQIYNLLRELKSSNKKYRQVSQIQLNTHKRESLFNLQIFQSEKKYDWVVVLHDITHHYQQLQTIRSQQLRLQASLQHTPLAFLWTDLKGQIIEVNPAFLSLYSYTHENIYGLTLIEIIYPEDLPLFLNQMKKIESGVQSHFNLQLRVMKNNRELQWSQITLVGIKNDMNRTTSYSIVLEDISERKAYEEALKESQEQLHFAVQVTQVGFFEWYIEKDLFKPSEQFNLNCGFEIGESVTFTQWMRQVHNEDRNRLLDQIENSIRSKSHFKIEVRMQITPIQYNWIEITGHTSYLSNGQPNRFFGTTLNVTQRKKDIHKIEQAKKTAEEANASKSSFLANMSHEIRTPLSSILGFAELIKKAKPSEEHAQKYLDVIIKNGKALTKIIDDILDLSKVEAGKLEMERAAFDYPALLDEVHDMLEIRAQQKGIHLHIEPISSPHILIKSDAARVRQILINLLGNSIKFTEKGSVTLRTHIDSSSKKSHLFVRIIDTGLGISPDQIEKLFQPFQQADESTTRLFGGTGLGLTLSRKLAQALGGDVILENTSLGYGSTFLFHIPIELAEDIPSALPNRPRDWTPSAQRLAGYNILVADDSEDNRMLIESFLLSEGAHYTLSCNGEEAVKCALAQDFDLILMDIQMPILDGYGALSVLKSHNYDRPVLAFTAHAMEEELEKTRIAGFKAHVNKPIDFEELVATIRRVSANTPHHIGL